VFGTILKRVTVRVLDGVVEAGKRSERSVVRMAATGLDRARGWVGLNHVDVLLVVPSWDGSQPDQPMWGSDRDKLNKWRMDKGITKPPVSATAEPAPPPEPALKIYIKRGCPYCRAAVDLAREREIPFAQIDYSDDDDLRRAIRNQTGRRTSPHIFIHGKSIGGYDELRELDQSGALAKLLKASADAVVVAPREVAAPDLGDDDDDDEAEEEAAKAAAEAAKAAAKVKGTTFVKIPKRVSLPVVHPERSPFESILFADEVAVDAERLEGDALIARVREVLDEVRPMVQSDGGDIELLDIQADVVGVRLTGNCIGCPSSQATLRQGIERKLKLRIPQIKGISSPQLQPGA
jgi:Fe-S cluster biogenesis protein NfuA/glutaredoxin